MWNATQLLYSLTHNQSSELNTILHQNYKYILIKLINSFSFLKEANDIELENVSKLKFSHATTNPIFREFTLFLCLVLCMLHYYHNPSKSIAFSGNKNAELSIATSKPDKKELGSTAEWPCFS